MVKIDIRGIKQCDKNWISNFLIDEWGSVIVVTQGKKYFANKLPGFIAEINGQIFGLITYSIQGSECEIITLNSLKEKSGVGTILVKSVINKAA